MVIPIYDNDPLEKSHRAYVTCDADRAQHRDLPGAGSARATRHPRCCWSRFRAVSRRDERRRGDRRLPAAVVHARHLHVPARRLVAHASATCCSCGCSATTSRMRSGAAALSPVLPAVRRRRAALAHMLASPGSNVPLVGASGAVAGIVAAYLMLRPVREDHRADVRLRSAQARLGTGCSGSGCLTQVWHVVSLEKQRHRLVGAYRRVRGRRAADTAVIRPARRCAVRVHASRGCDRRQGGAAGRNSAGDRANRALAARRATARPQNSRGPIAQQFNRWSLRPRDLFWTR